MMLPNKPLSQANHRPIENKCCGVAFLRHLIHVYNCLLMVSGLGVLAVGLYAFFLTHHYTSIIGGHFDFYMASIYLLIGTGGLIIMVVFVVGCCAVCQKNRTCIILYSVLLLVVLLLETCAGVVAYLYEALLKSHLSVKLSNSILYQYHNVPSVQQSLDHLQINHQCCGSTSYKDWLSSEWYMSVEHNPYNASVPISCCKSQEVAGCANAHQPDIHMKGCMKSFEGLINEQLILIGGVGLGLCCLQIFGIVVSCCLAKKLRKWKTRENQYWE
ncbi:hypothetical protein HELRODRAFT_185019 [Helobdella robusta]|uniref:Tetraspanin n=1 Tax=Helobdella robusta TaxID=6412 RepID=T1FMA4_HELRO|nr:hypothetical protein HELRODRAFT_185019 [Helobdella robusta]ESO02722.1 hypothetical protein HELRODRAFT_185019 [Helobdella robusta]